MKSDELLYALLLVELTEALRSRDGERAVELLHRLRAVQPVWTDQLTSYLIAEGLRHLAAPQS
jgi:hypothetical protein